MSFKLALLSLITVLPITAVSQLQLAPGRSIFPAAKSTHSKPASAILKGNSPADRRLMPYLRSRLGAAKPQSARAESVRPNISGASNQPNFGRFQTAPFYPARLEASCITDPYNCGVSIELTSDFDKDGKPDIAVIQSDGTLNLLLNNGSGGLASPVFYINPNYSSTFIQEGFAVDLNQDGYTDVLAFYAGNNAIIVDFNHKNGTFGPAQTADLNSDSGYVSSIALGDVDGDGILDLVAATASINFRSSTSLIVQTYVGSATGTFAQPTTALTQTAMISAQTQLPPFGVTLGDLNNDKKLDIALDLQEQTSQTTEIIVATVAIGNGDGTFGALNVSNPVSIPVAAQPNQPNLSFTTSGVQILDTNNDANADVSIDQGGVLYVALGNGSMAFPTTVQTPNIGASFQILYADVTGDGIPDFIQDNGLLRIWTGNGDGTFTLPANGSSFVIDVGGGENLTLADFNGDGILDIA